MERIKYDLNLIKLMSMFESVTGAKIRDAISGEEQLLFVVEENQIGRAIGKHGINIKRLEHALKRKIKIVEFNEDMVKFIENFIYPLKAREMKIEEKKVTIVCGEMKTRGLIIGREAKNIKFLNEVAKRYFDISEVRVVA